jgi:threonine/homoserine/homoserine lactone efflux protein
MPFAYGITVTVSNPYWWIWWLTFGAGFLAVHDGYAEFFAGHIGIDFLWLFLLAALAARGRTILGDHYRTVVRGCRIRRVGIEAAPREPSLSGDP